MLQRRAFIDAIQMSPRLASDLIKPIKGAVAAGVRHLDLELRTIQTQIKSVEDNYGPDVLQITVI